MRIAVGFGLALILAVSVGCEQSVSSSSAPVQAPGSMALPPPMPAAPDEAPAAGAQPAADAGAAPAATPDAATPAPDAAAPQDTSTANTEQAAVGAGVKGRDYGGPGFVTTPIEAMFRAEERIAFEAQIPNAMKIYKAAHNNKGPKTHEEFMEIIIKENAVPLPELPAGDSYLYDPKTEQLLVKHPAPAKQP